MSPFTGLLSIAGRAPPSDLEVKDRLLSGSVRVTRLGRVRDETTRAEYSIEVDVSYSTVSGTCRTNHGGTVVTGSVSGLWCEQRK